MNQSETLLRYQQRARAAGVEVALIAAVDFPGRLAAFLSENIGHSGRAAGLSDRTALTAALPATGWPQPLRVMVESVLGAAGFQIATPQQIAEGYAWERDQIAGANVGISFCPVFLADTGSMVIPAGPGAGTLASLLPEIHLVLSYPEGCRGNLGEYLAEVGPSLPSRFTLITGPSRTGDIEATMTTGVHGPGKVFHFILSE